MSFGNGLFSPEKLLPTERTRRDGGEKLKELRNQIDTTEEEVLVLSNTRKEVT